MTQWEYCEVDFNGSTTYVFYYDEAGAYIEKPAQHRRLGIVLAKLGHDGWEIVSSWWRNSEQVTYMLKRPCQKEWTAADRANAAQAYLKNRPKDR